MIDVDNCVRICSCCSVGKTSMIRSTVPWAPVVCSVPKTMCPVSAAVMAEEIVSRSRISPTRITSGSIRKARRSASGKLGTSTPTSRWLIIDFLCVVVILDRVFDRDDVMVEVLIHPVDHAGQAGRLAASGRTRHEKQSAGPANDVPDHRRQTKLLERQEVARNLPQDHGDMPALLEDGHAEPGLVAVREAEVGPSDLLQLLLIALGRDALHQRRRVLGPENLGFQPDETTMPADARGLPRRQYASR